MLKALLAFWLICGLISPAAAQSGMALPANIGPLKLAGTKKYDQPGLGVVYRYTGEPTVKGDVFIYDLDLKNLGRGLKSPQVKAHFEQVKADIYNMGKKGDYLSIVKVSEGETGLTTPAGKIPVLTATFTYSQKPGPNVAYAGTRVSHLLLTAYQDSFVKIRFTYPEAQKAQGDQVWRQFLADFGKNLK